MRLRPLMRIERRDHPSHFEDTKTTADRFSIATIAARLPADFQIEDDASLGMKVIASTCVSWWSPFVKSTNQYSELNCHPAPSSVAQHAPDRPVCAGFLDTRGSIFVPLRRATRFCLCRPNESPMMDPCDYSFDLAS